MESSDFKKPWIETPLIWSRGLSKAAGCNIYLKLENNQPSGSFKSRGIGNFVLSHLSPNGPSDASKQVHFLSSSGGNAGLACVHAAVTLGCPSTIVVPLSTSSYMIGKLREAGAHDVIQHGESWIDADTFLREELLPQMKAQGDEAVYVPPFNAQEIWDGNATMVAEILKQLPEANRHYPVCESETGNLPDAIICSVGGGGLFSGIMQGLSKHSCKRTEVLAVETRGADSLAQAVSAGELVTLPAITSIATTLGARTVAKQAFSYAHQNPLVQTVVMSDKAAVDACKTFADDERILVEPSCGVSLAVCYTGKLKEVLPGLKPSSKVVVVVCGGSGLSLDILAGYVKQFS